jgi:hydroxymethylpyrimidine/phosphomethylpyrimidine kinase
MAPRTVRVLSIAGSDSGGGAGIQADLRAFARCGVFGMTAVTAVTAQNTLGVPAVHPVPARVISAQIAAVLDDIGADAVKIGMLAEADAVDAVADALAVLSAEVPVVLDPVLAASAGGTLLTAGGIERLLARLVPRATVVTPNLPEALALTGAGAREADVALARALLRRGAACVVLTGGHRDQPADLVCAGDEVVEIPFERLAATSTHGSGCTHSAALAARLALGDDPLSAARAAQAVAADAIRHGHDDLGGGPGPVDALG